MNTNKFLTVLLLLICFVPISAKPKKSFTINPTVSSFDSIPSLKTELTYFIGTVQDTSVTRNESGLVGYTRVRRRRMAQLICDPAPILVLKRSLEAMIIDKGMNAESADSADYIIQILLYDFSLVETSKKISQTMEAKIAFQLKLIDQHNHGTAKQFTIKSQNSKSTLDTSKHAESILRGALENSLKEIMQSITK